MRAASQNLPCSGDRLIPAMQPHGDWLQAFRRYLVAIGVANLVWEMVQLPLYTLWSTAPPHALAFAVLHCTAGDIAIATVSFVIALAFVGRAGWPTESWTAVTVALTLLGAGYTIFSEYQNTLVRPSWAYTDWMPVLPWTGTGLAPLLQWLVIPPLASAYAARYGWQRS